MLFFNFIYVFSSLLPVGICPPLPLPIAGDPINVPFVLAKITYQVINKTTALNVKKQVLLLALQSNVPSIPLSSFRKIACGNVPGCLGAVSTSSPCASSAFPLPVRVVLIPDIVLLVRVDNWVPASGQTRSLGPDSLVAHSQQRDGWPLAAEVNKKGDCEDESSKVRERKMP